METRMFLQENKNRIEEEYRKRECSLPHVFQEINKRLEKCEDEVSLACKYLYAFMPYSDIGNYPFEYFLDYAENGVWLWRNLPQVAAFPEEIYLNYVLFHRVNEEEIAPCRKFFREKIGQRIAEMPIKEAALEVNYWCAEEVTYQSSDDRTLSAISVYQRGNGRCGEESVFTVNALRSVGIPARQVYAPKWSHCDDNHAWVEIWCEGQWYFLGACEPEPVLNKGWFSSASSRAMLIHSRVFDKRIPEGQVIGTEGTVTMLNELNRYGKTKKFCVHVIDESGNPVQGATLSFEVLNYSEYAKIAEMVTDDKGRAVLTTGFGSLHIWGSVRREGKWLYAGTQVQTMEEDCCEICLKAFEEEKEGWKAVDLIAPTDAPINTIQLNAEQKKSGRERLQAANARREQKVRGWKNPECERFLTKDQENTYRKKLLKILTEKDRTDCKAEVLEEHLQDAMRFQGQMSDNIFVPYVLNPRVDDEVLAPYRRAIRGRFSEAEQQEFRHTPEKIWEYIDENISSHPENERTSVITTPAGCLKTGTGSGLSKKILFVAIARTFGIPARLNPVDGSMEYWNEGEFLPVLKRNEAQGTLILMQGATREWTYFQNWSIAKLEEGSYHTLKLAQELFEDGRMALKLETGNYRILTANRLPNGNIFAYEYVFNILPQETKEMELKLREANLEDMLENLSLPEFILRSESGCLVNASDITKDGKQILMFLEEEKEPTEHILNELLEQKEAFKEVADRVTFVVREEEALQTATLERVLKNLPQIQIYYDDFSEIISVLGRRMYVDPDKLPVILVTNGKLNGIYGTSGYNVGCGELLLRLMR